MSTQAPLHNPAGKWIRSIVATFLPAKFFDEFTDSFDELAGRPLLVQASNAGDLLFRSYKTLIVRAVNLYEYLAEMALVLVIFGMAGYAGLSLWLVVPTAASLLALAARDVYSYEFKTSRKSAAMTPLQRYWLNSSVDAACATLFSTVAQGFVLYLEPSLAVPAPVLFRASLVALPLIATLRLLFRPVPDPQPADKRDMPATEMFRWAFGIALLWYVTFIITVMLGNTDIPHYWPDRLRGLFGGPPFLFWILIQRDTLERWSSATMHLVSLEQMALEKATRFLPVALRPGDPFYRSFTGLELIILFGLGICMEPIIRPWLQGWEGRPSNGFMVAASFMGLVICLCTWKYVKAVLYATSNACHAELKRIKQENR